MSDPRTDRRISRRHVLIGGVAASASLAAFGRTPAAIAAASGKLPTVALGAQREAAYAMAARPALGAQDTPTYPIADEVLTTRQRTVVPDAISSSAAAILLSQVSQFEANGIGNWHYGPGIDAGKRLDIMAPTYSGASVSNAARLVHFFTITDIHITDKESPSQMIYLQQLGGPGHASITSAYSPIMMYTTHVLDAAIQTVNALHKQLPIDFGISMGDTCNSTLHNELRWYIDVLDGGPITPSSGANAGAFDIDYQKPYRAAGLDRSIPWYQALGNHDHFWLGSLPMNDFLRQSCIGDTVLLAGDVVSNPTWFSKPDYYMGVINGATPLGDIIDAGPAAGFATAPKVVPDALRRSLSKPEWMSEFFSTDSTPSGHGFQQTNVDGDIACYSFVPKSSIPIRIIMLDDTQDANDGSPDFHAHGCLNQARYDWLKAELAAGQAADQLMIIAAHAPIGVELSAPYSEMGWWDNPLNAVTEVDLIAELQKYPNFVLWMAGHRHLNTVKPFKSPDPINHPEYGFWQVETSSLRDFPQQFRTFEIMRNSDGTISILTTDVDPAVEEGTPALKSRSYAVAAQQLVKHNIYQTPNPTGDPTIAPMPSGSYNAELVVQLTPKMQAKLSNAGSPLYKSFLPMARA